MAVVQTIFSISQQPYQVWQAELLAYSHARVAQSGPLTCLVSTRDHPQELPMPTFFTPPWSPHPVTGDDYAPYNKPYSLSQWTAKAPFAEETVLVLDPDCVFLRALQLDVTRGQPIAQPVTYMHPETESAILRRHGAVPLRLQQVAVPIAIHRSDLRELAPLWLKRTEDLRADPVARERFGWISEMWGCALAAAELGLRFQMLPLSVFPTENEVTRPILHYCYSSVSDDGLWRWDKRTYRPWERVSPPPTQCPAAALALLDLLNTYVAARAMRSDLSGATSL